MQRLTSDTGWALKDGRLFWTTDGGSHWRDITPSLSSQSGPAQLPQDETAWIASVFFLDTSRGWVLITQGREDVEGAAFRVASTTDAGETWSITSVVIPGANPVGLNGDGRLDFVDSLHGWMDLDAGSGRTGPVSNGILLGTEDGGNTWKRAAALPGGGYAGDLNFTTLRDGWLAGGPANSFLFETHDSSASWQRVSLKPPAQVPTRYIAYHVPIFEDRYHAVLPVDYMPQDGPASLVLYTTSDGGRSWTATTVLPDPPVQGGDSMRGALAGSGWVWARVTDRWRVALTTVLPGGSTTTTTMSDVIHAHTAWPGATTLGAILELSFVDGAHGWAWTGTSLLATDDGGSTWTDITPRPTRSVSTLSAVPSPSGEFPSQAEILPPREARSRTLRYFSAIFGLTRAEIYGINLAMNGSSARRDDVQDRP
jgi:photosystem II stability/assembly factor-like uncharacterized protein